MGALFRRCSPSPVRQAARESSVGDGTVIAMIDALGRYLDDAIKEAEELDLDLEPSQVIALQTRLGGGSRS